MYIQLIKWRYVMNLPIDYILAGAIWMGIMLVVWRLDTIIELLKAIQ